MTDHITEVLECRIAELKRINDGYRSTAQAMRNCVEISFLEGLLSLTAPVPGDWQPTAANVNALPAPLRRYIHNLETVCDPAGDVRELFILRQKVAYYESAPAEGEREAVEHILNEVILGIETFFGAADPKRVGRIRIAADAILALRQGGKSEAARLRKGIQDYMDGNFGHRFTGGKLEKCPHGHFSFEICEGCVDQHFIALLAPTPPKTWQEEH